MTDVALDVRTGAGAARPKLDRPLDPRTAIILLLVQPPLRTAARARAGARQHTGPVRRDRAPAVDNRDGAAAERLGSAI